MPDDLGISTWYSGGPTYILCVSENRKMVIGMKVKMKHFPNHALIGECDGGNCNNVSYCNQHGCQYKSPIPEPSSQKDGNIPYSKSPLLREFKEKILPAILFWGFWLIFLNIM